MLESKERREATRAQTALQMMQFAQAKKAQDFERAGKQIGFLNEVNTQIMGDQADQFMMDTGFSGLWAEHAVTTEGAVDDSVSEMYDELIKKRGDGIGKSIYGGFTNENALKIANAIWLTNNKNPKAILDIANELASGENKNLILSFNGLGYGKTAQDTKKLLSIQKTIQDQSDIRRELVELAGEDQSKWSIKEGIGMYDQQAKKAGAPSTKNVTDLVNKFKTKGKGLGKSVDDVSSAHASEDDIQEALDLMQVSDQRKNRIQSVLDNLNEEISDTEAEVAKQQSIVDIDISKFDELSAEKSANDSAISMLMDENTTAWYDLGEPNSISSRYPKKREQYQDLIKDNELLKNELKDLERDKEYYDIWDSEDAFNTDREKRGKYNIGRTWKHGEQRGSWGGHLGDERHVDSSTGDFEENKVRKLADLSYSLHQLQSRRDSILGNR